MSGAVKTIVIVGAGAEAWMCAAALARAFKAQGVTVDVVEDGERPAAGTAIASLPSLRALHGLIGLDERDLVRKTGAAFKLGVEYRDWSGEGTSFLHPHGEIGVALQGLPFYKLLVRQAAQRLRFDAGAFSVAALAMRAARFARPRPDGQAPFDSFTYAFHLDAVAYAGYLRAHAEALGARRRSAALAEIVRAANGSIAELKLKDGARVAGEVFLDCSGAAALLTTSAFESWRDLFPCDRILHAAAAALPVLPPTLRASAAEWGWTWAMPLQRWTSVGAVFDSRLVDEDAVAQALTRREAVHERVHVESFVSGRRVQFWSGNCVAIGRAAARLDPIAAADLHLAQASLTNFIGLYPRPGDTRIESAEYNRLMSEHVNGVRDFAAALYWGGPLRAGPLWRARPELPARVADKLDLFKACGRINLFDFEAFEENDWAWILLGRDGQPDALDLHEQALLETVDGRRIEALAASIRKAAESMPSQRDYLKHLNMESVAPG